MTTMYYADLQRSRVVCVEVRRVTDAQVVLATGRREAKSSQYGAYFVTYDEAAQRVRLHLEAKIVEARRELEYREHKLAAFDALQAVQP